MDNFYILQRASIKKVKDILVWANKNGLRTDVDMLNCSKSFSRVKADRSFEDVLEHITKASVGFFRIVFRDQWNAFGILSSEYARKDILEVFLRSIDIGPIEYFIFIYLEPEKLKYLMSKYALKML